MRPQCGPLVTQITPPASWPGPFISNIQPDSGPPQGRTTVVIAGRNFTGASAVRFGANPATSFVVDSDTQITAVSPPA
jgi:hypothetical protein